MCVVLQSAEEDEEASVSLSNVLGFHRAFWLLSISCVTVYASVLPFNNIAQVRSVQFSAQRSVLSGAGRRFTLLLCMLHSSQQPQRDSQGCL